MTAQRLTIEGLEDAALDRLFDRAISARLYLAPPVFLTTMALLAWDAAPWRRWMVAVVSAVAVSRLTWEAVRARRRGIDRARMASVLPVPTLVLSFVVLASGGVDSPVVAMLPVLTVFLGLFFQPRVGMIGAFVGTVLVAGALGFALAFESQTFMPELFGGGPHVSNPALLVTRAGVLLVALWWGAFVGLIIRRAFRSAIQTAVEARDQVLNSEQESTRTLTTLAAEIAHELKNPLASVKGLAALVDRDAQGKDKERLTVLRREVDRMQEILESFLTFSRPLVPLDVAPVALPALVQSVVELHEGLAHERQATFRIDARDLSVKADARKLKQVLINLVQNALDVTPAGGAVDLVVRSEHDGGAAVLVMDRGPGLKDHERVFEPGVTSKSHGNGLGLTVARLVARQHGGDVRLLARDGGGTIAELSLPGAPP